MSFSDSDATRIIASLEARLARKYKNGAQLLTTWGSVSAVDVSNSLATVYLYGEIDPAYTSEGFRIPETLHLAVGDKVKVAIDYATGERWVEEASVPTAYKKLSIGIDGEISLGSGTAATDISLYRTAAYPYLNFESAGQAAFILTCAAASTTGLYGKRTGEANYRWYLTETGLYFGAGGATAVDVRLYRYDATTLATDDMFRVLNSSGVVVTSATKVLRNFLLVADANASFDIDSLGKMSWGAGGATALDTNLYRSSASVIKTDDTFWAVNLTFGANGHKLADGGVGIGSFFTSVSGALRTNHRSLLLSASYADPAPPDAGIQFGADVTLARTAANVLTAGAQVVADSFATPGYPSASSTFLGPGSLELRSANPFIDFTIDGTADYGARIAYDLTVVDALEFIGALTYRFDNQLVLLGDVNLYRSAANVLKTDDAMVVAGGLTVSGADGLRADGNMTLQEAPAGAAVTVTTADTYYAPATSETTLFTPSYIGQRFLVVASMTHYANAIGVVTCNMRVTDSVGAQITSVGSIRGEATVANVYLPGTVVAVWTADAVATRKLKWFVTHNVAGAIVTIQILTFSVVRLP